MSLGGRIVAFRKEKNLTQEELAERSNVTLRTIQRIEKGETVPRGFTLRSIAQALDKQILDLHPVATSTNEPPREEVNSFLRLLNLLCLTYLIIPYGNLFIPWLVWVKKKDTSTEIKTIGKRIIVHQFLWMTILSLALLITAAIQILLKKATGVTPTFGIFPIFLLLHLLNIPIIAFAALHLKRGNHDIYKWTLFFVS